MSRVRWRYGVIDVGDGSANFRSKPGSDAEDSPNATALRHIVHEIVEKHLEDRAREAGKEQRGNQPSTGQNDGDRA